jgi:hypothetical protein
VSTALLELFFSDIVACSPLPRFDRREDPSMKFSIFCSAGLRSFILINRFPARRTAVPDPGYILFAVIILTGR